MNILCKKYEKMVKYCNDFASNDIIMFLHDLYIGVLNSKLWLLLKLYPLNMSQKVHYFNEWISYGNIICYRWDWDPEIVYSVDAPVGMSSVIFCFLLNIFLIFIFCRFRMASIAFLWLGCLLFISSTTHHSPLGWVRIFFSDSCSPCFTIIDSSYRVVLTTNRPRCRSLVWLKSRCSRQV